MIFNFLAGCRRSQGGRVSQTTVTLLIVLACALLLRLYHLNHYDLWFDELGTDLYTSQNLARMTDASKVSKATVVLDRMKSDPHSPLYYTVVYFYSILFGDGKSLRLLSVFFSMLSLGMLYQLSRLLFDRRVSLYALLIMMVNPFHLWYAQEARAYAMTCFLALWVVYIYLQAIQTNKRFYWILFPVAGILTLFSSYNSVLLLVATGMALFFKRYRPYYLKWIFSILVMALFMLLMHFVLIAQLSFVKTGFWVKPPTPMSFLYTWMFFNLGYTSTITQYQLALPLFFIAFSYGTYTCFRSDKPKAIIILSLLLLPIIGTYLLSAFITPIYIHRQLLIFSPFYYLLIANGLASIRNLKIQMIVVLCMGVLMITSLANYYQGSVVHKGNKPDVLLGVLERKKYDDVMMQMVRKYQEGDLIAAVGLQSYVITRSYVAKHFKRYNEVPFEKFCLFSSPETVRPFERQYLAIDKIVEETPPDNDNGLYGFALARNGKMEMAKIDLEDDRYQRIWLVTSNWIKFHPLETTFLQVKSHLSSYFNSIILAEHDGVRVELYTRKKNTQVIITEE